jgi:iron-sulfur cluster repair protein YtfE (RIC family)
MNLFDLLDKDHSKILTLIDKLEKTTTRAIKTRNELFTQLNEQLDQHLMLEEEIFYPELKTHSKVKALIKQAKQDHKEIRKMLKELKSLPRAGDEWKPKISELKKAMSKHLAYEEDKIFPHAVELLSNEQKEDIYSRVEEERKDIAEGTHG